MASTSPSGHIQTCFPVSHRLAAASWSVEDWFVLKFHPVVEYQNTDREPEQNGVEDYLDIQFQAELAPVLTTESYGEPDLHQAHGDQTLSQYRSGRWSITVQPMERSM
jgi:hypothetical protein